MNPHSDLKSTPKKETPVTQPNNFIARARKNYASDGVVEIDEDAAVSVIDKNRAYVAGWLYVDLKDS